MENNDILIYIESLKNYFKRNKVASNYFYNFTEDELFYELIKDYSIRNLEEYGSPELNQNQFEKIREIGIKKINKSSKKPIFILGIEFEKILYLN